MAAATPGLEEYQEIIDKLKPSIQSPNFESLLKSEGVDLSRAEIFLLKTELRRLGNPTKTPIDLRKKLGDDLDPFEYDGIVHYMNQACREVFEDSTADYGLFTQGVIEEVMASLQGGDSQGGEAAQEKKEEHGAPVKVINFNQFPRRNEERMNFTSSVEIIQDMTENIQAVTLDISMSGLRIKMDKKNLLNISEDVKLIFLGLEQDYSVGLKTPVQYKIISVETVGSDKRVALKRTFIETDDVFERFLHRFINGNKKRYRVNLDNTLEAVTAKTYEQFYVPRMMSLPLFIGQRMHQDLGIHFAMLNDNTRGFYQFWKDELGHNQLNHILSSKRLQFLGKKAGKTGYECLLYTFSQINNGKTMFFAALDEELLKDPNLYQQFLSYGAKKDSFSVIKLNVVPITPDQCYQPLSIPDTISETVKKANRPPAARLMAHIKDLKYMVMLTDITTDNAIHNFSRLPFNAKNADFLRKLVCKQGKPDTYIESVRFKYQNLRTEDRYFYKTPVMVENQGLEQQGVSVDFSVSGMKLDFEEPYPFDIGSYCRAVFPELQKLTERFKIKTLMYRVVHVNNDRTSISLSISEEQKRPAKQLFGELISSNRNRLKINGEVREMPGLDEALRNIFSTNLIHYPFFVQKDGAEVDLSFMAQPTYYSDLESMFRLGAENDRQFNLHALTQSKIQGVDFIETMLRKMDRGSRPIYRELLVKVNPEATHLNDIYQARFADEFPSDIDRINFIKRALNQGTFFALRVYLSRTVRPDTDFISAEMNYINYYAQHRGKVLEEEIWQVLGIGEVMDVTRELMMRYKLSQQDIRKHLDNRAKMLENISPQTDDEDEL